MDRTSASASGIALYVQHVRSWLDATAPYRALRWLATSTLLSLFLLRVFLFHSWFIVGYALGIYLFIDSLALLQPEPETSPMVEQLERVEGEEDSMLMDESYVSHARPNVEWKLWISWTRAIAIACSCTASRILDIPPQWPILAVYSLALLLITIARQNRYPKPWKIAAVAFVSVLILCVLTFAVFFGGGHISPPPYIVWHEHDSNPVLPDEPHSQSTGTVFDLGLWLENMTSAGEPADLVAFRSGQPLSSIDSVPTWRMWNSWRPRRGIGYSTSVDGKTWDQDVRVSLDGVDDTEWEWQVNRPFVKKLATGRYGMWYTGQGGRQGVGGWIGYAESGDGITFKRLGVNPVLVHALPWEKGAVMTPTVIDLPNDLLRMYYAAGETYEPDAIGVAHSYDGGRTWVKHGDPVLLPETSTAPDGWDSFKVTSPHVLYLDDVDYESKGGWYYMFYVGFRNVNYASIGLARSRDGLTGWERHVGNPIVDIRPQSWNCDAVYKPFAGWNETAQEWMVWYNGRCGGLERIGLSTRSGRDLGRFAGRS